MSKLSIVVPAHNEEMRIGSMLDSYIQFFRNARKKGLEFEIVVVLNACKDNTRKVVEERKCRELRIIEFVRGGKGFAVMEGFKDALKRDADFIGFVDADMATPPEAFYDLFIHAQSHDGAIASRYVRGAVTNPPPTLQRFVYSRVYNSVIRAMFLMSFRDTQCGAKIFTRDAVEMLSSTVSMTKWAFDLEMLYKARKAGLDIIEVPTVWSSKDYSKINALSAGPMMVLGIVRLRLLHSPLRRIIRVYDYGAEIVRKVLRK